MRVELHPQYSIFLLLDELCNVDLHNRGYYQVRVHPKTSPDVTVDVKLHRSEAADNLMLPACVLDGGVAVSRTVELVYADEELQLRDAFQVVLRCPAGGVRTPPPLELVVELWYAERDKPPKNETFTVLTKRTLQVSLHPHRLQSAFRPVLFEFFAFAKVNLGVLASVMTVMPRRRKPPPDPALSPKLRELHSECVSALLHSLHSIQTQVDEAKQRGWIAGHVNIEVMDVASCMADSLARLESARQPWQQLELDAAEMSRQLDTHVRHAVELLAGCRGLFSALLREHSEWLWKRQGEAFFFQERALSSLPHSGLSTSQAADLHTAVTAGKYMSALPRAVLFCSATDSPHNEIPVIFEERFLPSLVDVSVRVPTPPCEMQRQRTLSRVLASARRKSLDSLMGRSVRERKNRNGSLVAALNGEDAVKAEKGTPRLVAAREGAGKDTEEAKEKENGSAPIDNPMKELRLDCQQRAETVSVPSPRRSLGPLLAFVHERECMKARLAEKRYEGCLYSELASRGALAPSSQGGCRAAARGDHSPHLVVLVHGLEGGSEDLSPYRNFLRLTLRQSPISFLMSRVNQMDTWTDLEGLGRNLLEEVREHMDAMPHRPTRVSFIAHSLGGIIVRTAIGLSSYDEGGVNCGGGAEWLHPLLHTLLTLNTPHLGLAYGARAAHWGVAVVQWVKKSRSIEQLTMKDAAQFRDTFLYRLASNRAFSRFKSVLLVGSPGDVYVPSHSALLQSCKAAARDGSALGAAYKEMLSFVQLDVMQSPRGTQLVRYTAFPDTTAVAATHRITGRAAHTAPVDDDVFIEKLLSISAVRHFI